MCVCMCVCVFDVGGWFGWTWDEEKPSRPFVHPCKSEVGAIRVM